MTSVPHTLDRRFRDAAAAAGLLADSYDVPESPRGPLFLTLTCRPPCRTFGTRVLRTPKAVDPVVRELDEYFEGRRQSFDLPVDLRGRTGFSRAVLEKLARVPFGEVTTYGTRRIQEAAHTISAPKKNG